MRSCHCLLPALAAATLICASGAPAPALAAELASVYTKYDFKKCVALKSPHPDVVDVRACDGYGGIKVIWTSEPDSSSVDFGVRNDEGSLNIGSVYEVRNMIEWRGPQADGVMRPVAAIVRYDTGTSVSRLNVPRLVVYRVTLGKPSCVMAVVKGRDANQAARTIVDRLAAGFVCGRSKPIAP